MTGHWMQQTAAALIGVHLLAACVVAAVILLALPVAHRRHLRRSQVLTTRIALAGGSRSSALTSPEGGQATTGAGTPDSAPVVDPPQRVRVTCTAGVPRLAGMAWREPAWTHLLPLHPDSAPARAPLTGPAREVGTPDLPNGGVPTSSTRSDMTWAS